MAFISTSLKEAYSYIIFSSIDILRILQKAVILGGN
jgi:hypothetical protein